MLKTSTRLAKPRTPWLTGFRPIRTPFPQRTLKRRERRPPKSPRIQAANAPSRFPLAADFSFAHAAGNG